MGHIFNQQFSVHAIFDIMDTCPRVLVQFIVSNVPSFHAAKVELRGNCAALCDWEDDQENDRNVAVQGKNTGEWTLLTSLSSNSKVEWKVTVVNGENGETKWENMPNNRVLEVPDMPALRQIFRVVTRWEDHNVDCSFVTVSQLCEENPELISHFAPLLAAPAAPLPSTDGDDPQSESLRGPPHNSMAEAAPGRAADPSESDSTSTLEEIPDEALLSRQTSQTSQMRKFASGAQSFAKDSLDVDDDEEAALPRQQSQTSQIRMFTRGAPSFAKDSLDVDDDNAIALPPPPPPPPQEAPDADKNSRKHRFGELMIRDSLDIALENKEREGGKSGEIHTASTPIEEEANDEDLDDLDHPASEASDAASFREALVPKEKESEREETKTKQGFIESPMQVATASTPLEQISVAEATRQLAEHGASSADSISVSSESGEEIIAGPDRRGLDLSLGTADDAVEVGGKVVGGEELIHSRLLVKQSTLLNEEMTIEDESYLPHLPSCTIMEGQLHQWSVAGQEQEEEEGEDLDGYYEVKELETIEETESDSPQEFEMQEIRRPTDSNSRPPPVGYRNRYGLERSLSLPTENVPIPSLDQELPSDALRRNSASRVGEIYAAEVVYYGIGGGLDPPDAEFRRDSCDMEDLQGIRYVGEQDSTKGHMIAPANASVAGTTYEDARKTDSRASSGRDSNLDPVPGDARVHSLSHEQEGNFREDSASSGLGKHQRQEDWGKPSSHASLTAVAAFELQPANNDNAKESYNISSVQDSQCAIPSLPRNNRSTALHHSSDAPAHVASDNYDEERQHLHQQQRQHNPTSHRAMGNQPLKGPEGNGSVARSDVNGKSELHNHKTASEAQPMTDEQSTQLLPVVANGKDHKMDGAEGQVNSKGHEKEKDKGKDKKKEKSRWRRDKNKEKDKEKKEKGKSKEKADKNDAKKEKSKDEDKDSKCSKQDENEKHGANGDICSGKTPEDDKKDEVEVAKETIEKILSDAFDDDGKSESSGESKAKQALGKRNSETETESNKADTSEEKDDTKEVESLSDKEGICEGQRDSSSEKDIDEIKEELPEDASEEQIASTEDGKVEEKEGNPESEEAKDEEADEKKESAEEKDEKEEEKEEPSKEDATVELKVAVTEVKVEKEEKKEEKEEKEVEKQGTSKEEEKKEEKKDSKKDKKDAKKDKKKDKKQAKKEAEAKKKSKKEEKKEKEKEKAVKKQDSLTEKDKKVEKKDSKKEDKKGVKKQDSMTEKDKKKESKKKDKKDSKKDKEEVKKEAGEKEEEKEEKEEKEEDIVAEEAQGAEAAPEEKEETVKEEEQATIETEVKIEVKVEASTSGKEKDEGGEAAKEEEKTETATEPEKEEKKEEEPKKKDKKESKKEEKKEKEKKKDLKKQESLTEKDKKEEKKESKESKKKEDKKELKKQDSLTAKDKKAEKKESKKKNDKKELKKKDSLTEKDKAEKEGAKEDDKEEAKTEDAPAQKEKEEAKEEGTTSATPEEKEEEAKDATLEKDKKEVKKQDSLSKKEKKELKKKESLKEKEKKEVKKRDSLKEKEKKEVKKKDSLKEKEKKEVKKKDSLKEKDKKEAEKKKSSKEEKAEKKEEDKELTKQDSKSEKSEEEEKDEETKSESKDKDKETDEKTSPEAEETPKKDESVLQVAVEKMEAETTEEVKVEEEVIAPTATAKVESSKDPPAILRPLGSRLSDAKNRSSAPVQSLPKKSECANARLSLNIVNDDHLYPDAVTPTKVESSLLVEDHYDVPFIDDEAFYFEEWYIGDDSRWNWLEIPALASIDECALTISEVPSQCNSPKKDAAAQQEISGPATPRRQNFLVNLCGCVGRRRR